MKKFNEKIIICNGKPVFAVAIENKKSNKTGNSTYIYMKDGRIYFSDTWYSNIAEFDFSDDSHKIAKEMFISQLQVDIKCRILELKQLEAIFEDIDMKECFGTVLIDNTKLLLEIKNSVADVSEKAKGIVEDAVRDTVKNVALKKKRNIEDMVVEVTCDE